MFQSWRQLLFAHWPVPHGALRPLVPAPLELEEFGGRAWLGVTPFRLTDLRPRYLRPLPVLSEFPELNLRTYVRVGERRGIYFFTLEAARRLAVWGARTLYRLPYDHASMGIESRDGWIAYRSRRTRDAAEFAARYRPTGPVFHAQPGTLEHFLIERYALYVVLRSGAVWRADVHHRPWPLQPAEVVIERNDLPAAHRIPVPERAPWAHYAARQDVLVWPPKRIGAAG